MKQVEYVRGGNRVKRYHTVDLLVPETVGHHSANVALLAYFIHPELSREGLLLALTHDLTEQFTGDVPAPAKWASDALRLALTELESHYEQFELSVPPIDVLAVKQADMLDLCFKCLEEYRMGSRAIMPLLHRGLLWLRSHHPLPKTIELLEDIQDELRK